MVGRHTHPGLRRLLTWWGVGGLRVDAATRRRPPGQTPQNDALDRAGRIGAATLSPEVDPDANGRYVDWSLWTDSTSAMLKA